jgi:glutathione synthase/RimK-type ligase-like ATP-grasp enzyme
MNITITSPRAPAAIEWIGVAQRSGHHVTVIDTLRYPLGAACKNVTYMRVPSPRFAFEKYKAILSEHIKACDLLIPTCEDIFYVSSALVVASDRKKVFMPQHNLLLGLHNKFTVHSYLNRYVQSPRTTLITKREDVTFSNKRSILKPVFSRFGANIILDVQPEAVQNIECSPDYPWVQQEFIPGNYICNYAVIQNGKVISHAVYRPKYLVNNAASTYFERIEHQGCADFIRTFAVDHAFTGQIAFDFIENESGLYVLECNPRATSGIHLIAESLMLVDGVLSARAVAPRESCRVGSSLFFMFGLLYLRQGRFGELVHDYTKAYDVLTGISKKTQLWAFVELWYMAFKNNIPFATATAFDIEYNG